jgi:23S rRNA (guanosine2251-2'-O)-methyltransferase
MHSIVVLAEKNNIPLTTVSRQELDKMVNGHHQGIIADCSEHPTYHETDLECLLAEISKPLLLVLDSITDPHNLGACLRSADAAGVDAVIIPKDKSATVNATVRKVACGAAESVPIISVTNLARVLRQLKDAGIWLYGLAGEAQESIYKADLTGNVAIVMGAEGSGLRRLTRDHCDYLVNIPMLGHVNSLNVSVATGVALFEVVRQRSAC